MTSTAKLPERARCRAGAALPPLVRNWWMMAGLAVDMLIVWGLLTGIRQIVAAVGRARELAAHWLVATAGAPSMFLALVVLALPHADSERAALALATYAIVFGIAITLASLRFRRAWL